MKALVLFFALVVFGWVAVVTFFGPELARSIDRALPGYVAKPVKRAR